MTPKPPATPGSSLLVSDLVLGACALVAGLGWVPLPQMGERNIAFGIAVLGLFVAEHYAFAHAVRSSLRRLAQGPNRQLTPEELDDRLPGWGMILVYGSIMRLGLRLMAVGLACNALGLAPEGESVVATVLLIPLALFEVIFGFYWIGVLGTSRDHRGRDRKITPARAAWLARQVKRAGTLSHRRWDLSARGVLLLWSCGVYAFVWPDLLDSFDNVFDNTTPETSLAGTGLLLLFALLVSTFLFLVPIHLDTWLDRHLYSNTRAARWRLRGAAVLSGLLAFTPLLVDYWRFCRA